ncbi:tRNA 2-selenouridine(34) synthase MnmH [Chitinophaga agrisoli]|uniref:tRNA 2-selenouridine(34) synthase MnmH n=1 Tax=Chitinophaga agrisoli TaxID=2607653 RepID=A0A5B2VK19_9BACT|nr:tRNA 2-selenouridine(34) synthase MnmH [Chitinophaga agrisoli]KAA2238632.1 tRNA 2-selenouridine(34) synthase MnmH [Chitinophaga agrisoli]
MIRNTTIDDLIKRQTAVPLIDVRTPAEFEKGHVPGAFNIPLFSNEERVQVGTTYKQTGREAAILLGFDLTGPKWSDIIRKALEIAPDKKVAVHCWRGGMRSGAVAWALDLYGFTVYLIQGGYKHYRRWVHQQFATDHQLWILGGMTGSGKTRILQQMMPLGQQVIDLEELAQHQGSSYGSMNKLVQPTQEQFENNLADRIKDMDTRRPIWIEDESLNIGRCLIPHALWNRMRQAVLFDLKVPLEQRVASLVQEYGILDKDFLVACTERIHKRLGPEQTKNAIAAIREDRMEDFIRIVLVYYDKTYRTGLGKRAPDHIFPVTMTGLDTTAGAQKLISFITNFPATEKA